LRPQTGSQDFAIGLHVVNDEYERRIVHWMRQHTLR